MWAASVALVTLAISLFFALNAAAQGRPSAEAVVRMGIASELAGQGSRGYRALIDSVMLPPLPTLGAAAFLWAERIGWGAGFYILTSLAAMGAAAYLVAMARLLRMPWGVGALLAAIALLAPGSPLAAWRGSAATGSFFFATAISTHLLAWLRREQLMSLGMAAVVLGFAILWDTRFLVFVPAGAALVAGHVRATPRARRWARLEGLSLVFLTPVLYMPAVWVLFNWLIFGNPLWLLHDAPPGASFLIAWVSLIAFLGGAAIYVFFQRRSLAEALMVGLYGLATVGLLIGALAQPSHAAAAARGRNATGQADRATDTALRLYAERNLSGRLILAAGKPGYQVRRVLGPGPRVVHRLNLADLDNILRDTAGRDLYAVLSADQAARWRAHFGEEFWRNRFLEVEPDRFGRWHIFWCIRPADLME